MENYAEAEASQADPDLSNNSASAVTDVIALKIANIFSANGDGINDFFERSGLELFEDNELYIFNRWGAELFHIKKYQNNWDGRNLNERTYYDALCIRMESGKWETFKGYITIKRER
ncbi:gliding motility-associated C-terminal domain-containing protein [Olivibacter sp. SDN3]|uniref:gliding motility-associated C-terminal domain-containing protein n=1 Tax=Olivibacter sp. SDN3 TaxID=2764720 RepID=UPI0016511B2F|nr:gliding motility-associated C-terminal domain-containing protein [Olivibacter sp. SDN3]